MSRSATPETTLENGLRARGWRVDVAAHTWRLPRSGVDVVHVHHFGKGALVAAAGRKPPVVLTVHGLEQSTRWRDFVVRRIENQVAAVVALSNFEGELLRAHAPTTRIEVIPNGINPDDWPFHNRRAPESGKPWRILFVGQLIPVKRVDLLLEAVHLLSASAQLELRLAFHNPLLEQKLRTLAAELGIGLSVRFLGTQEPQELRAEYEMAHVVVLPSDMEALPSVITEAMYSGVPVVATSVGGVTEQVSGFGTLTAPGSAESIADALAGVIGNYDSALALAVRARRHAISNSGIESMLDAHVRLYTELADRRSG